jgi:hypothetical protein
MYWKSHFSSGNRPSSRLYPQEPLISAADMLDAKHAMRAPIHVSDGPLSNNVQLPIWFDRKDAAMFYNIRNLYFITKEKHNLDYL